MRKLIVCLILLPSLAFAQNQQVRDIVNNKWIPAIGDPTGVPYVTERYPGTGTCVTLASGLTLAAGAAGIAGTTTAPFPGAHLYQHKIARIRATGWGPPDSSTVNFYIQGSIDGGTWNYIVRSNTNRTAPNVRNFLNNINNVGLSAAAGFNEVFSSTPGQLDTLGWVLDATWQEIAAPGVWIIEDNVLSQIPTHFQFIRFFVFNRTSAAGGTLTYDIEICARK